jgi:hypothetical protein
MGMVLLDHGALYWFPVAAARRLCSTLIRIWIIDEEEMIRSNVRFAAQSIKAAVRCVAFRGIVTGSS